MGYMIWGSYYSEAKAIFYLLKGDYRGITVRPLDHTMDLLRDAL